MFRHYFTTAFRHLKNHRLYTFIAIIGLALGMTSFLVLMNYVQHERSYDAFQKDAGQIYRCEAWFEKNGVKSDSWASSSFGYARVVKDAMPEVKDITRVDNYDCERIVRYQNNIFREPRVVFADSNFFSFFSYPLLKGNIKEVLKQPNTIAISESMAKKYFGNEEPMGKMLEIKNQTSVFNCMVTGVFKDFPSNSHLHLNLLMSYMTATDWERDFWYMHEAYTYAKTNSDEDARAIERKFPALAEKYKTDPVTMKDHTWGIDLVPLKNIHLNPAKPYEMETKGNKRMISFLFIIGMVILVVGWINYINIVISKTIQRAGEISVRRVLGAGKRQLLRQFMAESLLVNFLSLLVVIGLLMVSNSLISKLFSIDTVSYLAQWQTSLGALLTSFAGGTLITGLVPVIVLQKLDPVNVLKNKSSFRSAFGLTLREALIGFQYFAAVVLIVATIMIEKQVHFMQSADTGINMDQTLVVQTPAKEENYDQRLQNFVEELNRINNVKSATVSSAVPGKPVGYVMANKRADDPEKRSRLIEMMRVDENFVPTFGLELVAGRNFSKTRPADKQQAVILNEAGVKFFGFSSIEAAINGYINLEGHNDQRFPVIGVVKNYHHLSLKENFIPYGLMMYSPWNWIQNRYISISIQTGNLHNAMAQIESKYKTAFPSSSFDAYFLNDYFNRQYNADKQYGRMVMFFAWLALVIVCMGILGLSSFILLKRTKEIGIRKVVGADASQLLVMLNKRFIKTFAMAFAIGIPVAWFAMDQWLQNFANRTTISWWVFATAAAITLLVSVVTVSLQSYKVITGKMANALRSE